MSLPFRRWRYLLLGIPFVALFIAGCAEESIHSYRVARPRMRLLGAMIPRNEKVWFVKLVAPVEAMAEVEDSFNRFLQSIRFSTETNEPTWTLPEDWKAQRNRDEGIVFATFRLPLGLEVTVSGMSGPQAADQLANVNRWRRQMGLKLFKREELKTACKEVEIGGVKNATRIDMTGAADELSKVPRQPIEYDAPSEWKRMAPKMEQVALFSAGDDGKVEISIAQAGGTVSANVQRWRGQVGLPEASDNEVRSQIKDFKIAGEIGSIVDLTGELKVKMRIVGVIVPRDDRNWFFKMRGPAQDVEKVRPAFERFLSTVRFNEGE